MATRRPKKSTSTKTTTTKKPTTKKPTTATSKTTPKKSTPLKKVSPTKEVVVKKPVVRKKPIGKKTVAKKKVIEELLARDEPPKIRLKRKMYEYEKLAQNAHASKFHEMGQRVQRGEMKWAYYTTEDDIGYHYYVKLK